MGLGGAKHELDLDLTPYMESVLEDENPPKLESEELEVEMKNKTSDRVMNHWPRQQRFDGWVSSRVIDESERVGLERGFR